MTEMWLEVLDKVATLATAADLPPTEILVVGDHAPPLWSRRGRSLFEPGKVTWFRLTTRPDDPSEQPDARQPKLIKTVYPSI